MWGDSKARGTSKKRKKEKAPTSPSKVNKERETASVSSFGDSNLSGAVQGKVWYYVTFYGDSHFSHQLHIQQTDY